MGPYITHFCLGASGFEARDGEAVYAGAFDLSGEQMRPDMTLRDDLVAPTSPAAVAEVRHRAADWTYGDRQPCEGASLYALDLRPAVQDTPPFIVITPVAAAQPATVETAPTTPSSTLQ